MNCRIGFRADTAFRCASMMVVVLVLLMGAWGVIGAPAVSASGLTQGWTQVVKGGFTDPNNSYITAWAAFKEYLYVSTAANESGSVFSGSSKSGGDIWRTADGITWEQVGAAGLGNPHNYSFQLIVFRDRLYAIANNIEDHGLEVWVTSDGVEFTKIEGGGFGDENNEWAFPWVFKDRLILGVCNIKTGGEIWVSEDGASFRQVVAGGMGHPEVTGFVGRSDPRSLDSVFDGMLYIGVSNPAEGGEIWRTADGLAWERVAEKGLTRTDSLLLSPAISDGDKLYAFGTGGGTIDNLIGFDLYRTTDGVTWEQVIKDGFGVGDERNVSAGLVKFRDRLYLATNNMDPRILNPSAPAERHSLSGFQLMESSDGKNWTQVGEDGFGTPTTFMAGLQVQGDCLYLSAVDYHTGDQLWRSTDGRDWELIFQVPDPSFFQEGGGPLPFKGHFLFFSNDLKRGAQIWRSNEVMVAEETTTTFGSTTTEGPGPSVSSDTAGSADVQGNQGGTASATDDQQEARAEVGQGVSGRWVALFVVLGLILATSIAAVVFVAVRLTRMSSGGGGSLSVHSSAQRGSEPSAVSETQGLSGADRTLASDAKFCSACGRALSKEARYCPGCGTPASQ